MKKNGSSVMDKDLENKILTMTLTEFSRQEIKLEIYSKTLNEKLWIVSKEQLAKEVRKSNPASVVFTALELRRLLKLKIDKEFLRRIFDVKKVFNPSQIIKGQLIDLDAGRVRVDMTMGQILKRLS